MLLQDVKEIKNGRIISGHQELTLDSKTKDSQEDTINKLKGFGYEINGKLAGGSVNMTKKSKSSGGAFNVIVNSEGLVNGYPLESVMYLVQNVGDSKTKDDNESQYYKEGYLVGVREKERGLTQPPYFGTKEREDWINGYLKGYADSHSSKDSKTKDYERCPCGKGYFEETGHDWLGEDKNGIGRTRIYEECTGCGKKKSYIITEGGKVVYDSKTKDSKSTKDQIAELECQKEEAKKMGYGTDAYDAAIKELQKDALVNGFEIKASPESRTWVIMKDGDVIKRFNTYEEAYNFVIAIGKRYEKEFEDSADIFTQDPLTEKGKEILAAMKEQYGEEKGEQVFYASKNAGKLTGVDKKTKDDAYTENRISALKKEIEKVKESAKKEGGFFWNTRQQLTVLEDELKQLEENRKTSTDSKTKDFDERQEYIKELQYLLQEAKRDKNFEKAKRIEEEIAMMQSEISKDSKTKDDYTYPEDFIQFGWNIRQNGSKIIATKGQLKYEGSPYEIVPKLKQWLTDYTLEQKYGSKDSDIIINVIEKEDESEEAFDLIHYNGYNIKLVKETGEFDIYDVGGAMIGHTATLELARLFIDNKGSLPIE